MGTRAPKPVMRKAKAVATPAAVQLRVDGLVDGFLAVAPEEKGPARVREKVVRKLRQFHPMD